MMGKQKREREGLFVLVTVVFNWATAPLCVCRRSLENALGANWSPSATLFTV